MYYPDTIYLRKATVTQDEAGGPVESAVEWVKLSECRIEGNGGASAISVASGKTYVYKYAVYMPAGLIATPKKGDTVRLRNSTGTIDQEMTVQDFMETKFHCRLWV